MPHFNEASAQRSLRDGDAVARHWIKNKRVMRQVSAVTQNVHSIQRQIDRMRKYRGGSAEVTLYHPFKILLSPTMPDATRIKFTLMADGGEGNADDPLIIAQGGGIPLTEDLQWRTFRVRAGRIGDGVLGSVNQTDGANSNPDDITDPGTEEYAQFDTVASTGCDFTVPKDTAFYLIYADRVSVSAGVWYVRTAATDDGSIDGITFGTGDYVLLASIDTSTYSADEKAIVRQYVRTDLFEPAISCNSYA